jgi:hypothetical protein
VTNRVLCSLALALALLACSEPPPSLDGVGEMVPEPPAPAPPDPGSSLYDEEGVPRESDERVAGLVLPRGLTKVDALSGPRRHAYHSEVPVDRLLRYFGPRLLTGNVEQLGSTVIYRQATPRGSRGGRVELDVRIEPTSGHPAFVEIYELPPPPLPGVVISEEEIRRHFEQRQRTAE